MYRRGDIVLPDEDTGAALYQATAEEAGRFGLSAYEVSNYAVPGGESRHNLAYWRYADYAGIWTGRARQDHASRVIVRESRNLGPRHPAMARQGGSSPPGAIAPRSLGRNVSSAMATALSNKSHWSRSSARGKCC